ncbi:MULTISPECIES: tripartite tricarboxylate transporter substrate binding protein [unclassified Variovorax]|uniref:Bug family tripartite tricarboxylate transporter substrate binding protein n=1 Tax=unclassified Variovorax TaxID=663243 RepID=UPI001BD6CFF3|nr:MULTISPECIES: tripartite tricarboxylate transporter substrate binding protein [unclassified Variovorax]
MKRRSFAFLAAGIGLGLVAPLASAQSDAQSFPTKPVRIISPFSSGSGPDAAIRVVAEKLGANWKQGVVIDPRPGGSGFLAANVAKQAPPTGYDLFLADVGHLAINPSLFKKLPYDPKNDFVPVGGLLHTSFFIVVGANSPYRTVKDLLAAAAAAPGKITYGSTSVGGPPHLGAAEVEAASGTRMTHVPYKEISQLNIAVSNGEVDWTMGSLASSGALLKGGKVRFLAIADDTRSASLPSVPTLEEAGGPKGVQARSWVALMAPKGTPAAVIATLNQSLNEALKQAEVAEKFATFGYVPDPMTPAALAKLIDRDTVTYEAIVKRTGASAD